jgi:polar amino acid transport system permease protein
MLSDYAIWLREHAGWSFTVFYDTFDGARFIGGITMTLALCVICIGASLVTGYALYLLESVAKGGWSRFNDGFVAVFRNTPPLVQIYLFYFGLGVYLNPVLRLTSAGFMTPGVFWSVIAISLFGAAFHLEALRGARAAVPPTIYEAVEVLGLTPLQAQRKVLLPLVSRFAIPALTNNVVEVVKTTAYAYAVGVAETLYVATQVWNDALNVREMMLLVFCVYAAIISAVVLAMRRIETAYAIKGYLK